MARAEVVNVVARAELGCKLNLDFVRLGLGDEAEYRPDHFPAVVYRPKDNETVLFFKTGRLVCTGSSSPERARELIQASVQRLIELGLEIPQPLDVGAISAKDLDEKVMDLLGVPETFYTNYCVYSDSWSTPKGHAAGFVRRWVDRGPIKLELESLTSGDVQAIMEAVGILTDQRSLRVLRTITDEMMSVSEIAAQTKIEENVVEQILERLRQGRLVWRWTNSKQEGGGQLQIAYGGRVVLHLLSMLQMLVLKPSKWSVIGREELYAQKKSRPPGHRGHDDDVEDIG